MFKVRSRRSAVWHGALALVLGVAVPSVSFAQATATAAETAKLVADIAAESDARAALADVATKAKAALAQARALRGSADGLRGVVQANSKAGAGEIGDVAGRVDGAVKALNDVVELARKALDEAPPGVSPDASVALVKAMRHAAAAQKGAEKAKAASAAADKDSADALKQSDGARAAATAVADAVEAGVSEAVTTARAALVPPPPLTEADKDVLAALGLRLSGGSIMSNGHLQATPANGSTPASVSSKPFGEAAVYLAVEAQPALFGGRGDVGESGYGGQYLDPFLNLRLTTVGVAAPTTTVAAPDTSFVESQKSAQFQLGVAYSLNFGGFSVNHSSFHWGVGPVVRFGFQSVTDSQRAVRIWNLQDDLYDSQSLGGRLALFKRTDQAAGSTRRPWVPAAFVDVTWGHFQNFDVARGRGEKAQACITSPAPCIAKPDPDLTYDIDKAWRRLNIEARMYLDYVYLGLELNNGKGGDDLRVIAGLSMSLDKVLRR